MRCWQVYSGHIPFHHVVSDYPVMFSVIRGQRPPKPAPQFCKIYFHQPSCVWSLIEICWAQTPKRRPAAGEIVRQFKNIHSSVALTSASPEVPLRTKQSLKSGWTSFISRLKSPEHSSGKSTSWISRRGYHVLKVDSRTKQSCFYRQRSCEGAYGAFWVKGRSLSDDAAIQTSR